MTDIVPIRSRVSRASLLDPPPPDEMDLAGKLRNDIGNAERLQARYGHKLMSVAEVGWHVWDGRRWDGGDGKAKALPYAHLTAKKIFDEARALEQNGRRPDEVEGHRKWAGQSGNTGKIHAMLDHSMPYLRHQQQDLDADHYLFNVENGTLVLGSVVIDPVDGQRSVPISIRPHNPADRITKIAPVEYDSNAERPHWDAFLRKILPDASVRSFMQRFFGYCMTGNISEQVLALCYGTGSNGKSTMLETLAEIFGDYSATASIQTFLHDDRKRGSEASPDLARLAGARFVGAAEPDAGARLSENVIKTITGGEKITARHLNEGFIEYVPAFKLVISCNQKPRIRGQDEGIWRRILMVPFTQYIPVKDRDRDLRTKLRAEAPGILNWLLDGYAKWREDSLNPPEAVLEATAEYRRASDPIGIFVEDWTARREGAVTAAADLYDAYVKWCELNSVDPSTKTRFGTRLVELGYEKGKKGNISYLGIELTPEAVQNTPLYIAKED